MPDSFLTKSAAVVTINSVELHPIEVDGQRVVTLAMIDEVHGRPSGTARKRFNDNRHRMIDGKHFLKMSASVFRTRFPGVISERATEDVTIFTERGYLMLVKSFTDDLAWQVQDMLVEAYFKTKEAVSVARPAPRIDISREARLTMSQNLRLAKMLGFSGNQAALSANRATVAMTGVDTLSLMGATHLPAPQNDALLTPTNIGSRFGLGSARAVNTLLCRLGLQRAFRDGKGSVYYEPTEEGRKAGGIMLDTGKKHGTGTPVRQLKWSSSVIDYLEAETNAA